MPMYSASFNKTFFFCTGIDNCLLLEHCPFMPFEKVSLNFPFFGFNSPSLLFLILVRYTCKEIFGTSGDLQLLVRLFPLILQQFLYGSCY